MARLKWGRDGKANSSVLAKLRYISDVLEVPYFLLANLVEFDYLPLIHR